MEDLGIPQEIPKSSIPSLGLAKEEMMMKGLTG